MDDLFFRCFHIISQVGCSSARPVKQDIVFSDFKSVFLPLFHQAVTALVKNFPKPMVSSMQQILPIVWNTLTESAALYPLQLCVLLVLFGPVSAH